MTAINDLISSFLLDQDVVGSSKVTYRNAIGHFYKYLSSHDIDVKTFNKADVLAYKNSLSGKYSPHTINTYLSSLRGYLKWMKQNKHIESDIMFKNVDVDQYDNRKPLTDYQLKKLIKSIRITSDKNYRDLTMIRLMAAVGLRVSEVVNIQVVDIVKSRNIMYIMIKGKGKVLKNDRVRITPAILLDLQTYITAMKLQRNEYLFSDPNNRTKPMSSNYVSQIVKDRLLLAGIRGKEYSAHSLRHTFAVRSVYAGMTIEQVSSALRHKSIDTTMIYLSKYRANLINSKKVGNIIDSHYFIMKPIRSIIPQHTNNQ